MNSCDAIMFDIKTAITPFTQTGIMKQTKTLL